MKKYRWNHPAEWLREYASTADETELRGILNSVIGMLDADQIQDVFQTEMDDGGYFTPIVDAVIPGAGSVVVNITPRWMHENREQALAFMRGLGFAEDVVLREYETAYGDRNGTFAEKYGDDADEPLDVDALTADLAIAEAEGDDDA